MNVGIDSHSAEREGEGNSTYCRGLVSALLDDSSEDDFTLFSADPSHVFYRFLRTRGRPEAVRVAQGRGVARLAFALGRAATRERADCLHTQYFAPLGYGGPLILTVHDAAYLHVPDTFPTWLRVALRTLVPRSLARATHILTVSEFSRQDIARRYGVSVDRITVIPEAARTTLRPSSSDATTKVLSRYGLKPGFVFALGRLNRRKNLSRLIEACTTPQAKPTRATAARHRGQARLRRSGCAETDAPPGSGWGHTVSRSFIPAPQPARGMLPADGAIPSDLLSGPVL